MSIFSRRKPEVRADVGLGFWVKEATALQRAIAEIKAAPAEPDTHANIDIEFTAGADNRVVTLWRNTIVGFVPDREVPGLQRQLKDAGPARLVSEAHLTKYDGLLRIWAGPWPGKDNLPTPPPDEIEPEPNKIFGVPFGNQSQNKKN